MIKLRGKQSKWLAGLVLLILAVLVITGCPTPNQTPTGQPPTGQPPTEPTPTVPPPTDEPPPNQPPVIDSLASKYLQVKRAMEAPVECVATDPESGELSYTWSASGGSFVIDGAMVSWVAPYDYGTFTITVTVTDDEGAQATETIDIRVACCPIAADE